MLRSSTRQYRLTVQFVGNVQISKTALKYTEKVIRSESTEGQKWIFHNCILKLFQGQ